PLAYDSRQAAGFAAAALSFPLAPPGMRARAGAASWSHTRPMRLHSFAAAAALMTLASVPSIAAAQEPDWNAARTETLEHLQAMIRMNTVNPPGSELQVARYLDSTLK